MKIRSFLKLCVVCVAGVMAFNVAASPNTEPSETRLLRPYANGTMFVQIASGDLSDGGSCSTVYRVRDDQPGAKASTKL